MIPETLSCIPHVEQYFGSWAMEINRLRAITDTLTLAGIEAHVAEARRGAAVEQAAERPLYRVEDGLAVFEVVGTMTKYGSSFSQFPGTLAMRRGIRQAAADESVRALAVIIDSPGGSVSGMNDLAIDVARVAAMKPVGAYIEDWGASGAYYLASQASRGLLWANPSGGVGSIGTYAVIQDWSKAYAGAGVKVSVVRAGQFKGAGREGTEITDEQLANFQREIDSLNAFFVAAVACGRRISMEEAAKLADGRMWFGAEAVTKGLIDRTGTFEEFTAALRAAGAAGVAAKQRSTKMADENRADSPPAPKAATLAELKSLEGTSAEFRESCLEQGLALEQATARWAGELAARNKALTAENAKLSAANKAPPAGKSGLVPTEIESAAAGAGTAADEVERRVVEKMRTANLPRHEAHARVMKEDSDLRERFVAEHNAARGK